MIQTTKQKFDVFGMSCAACSARVERAVRSVDGVKNVTVSLLTNEMFVEYEQPATENGIISAVKNAGYGAALQKEKPIARGKLPTETRSMIKRLIPSACSLLVLMYFSMGAMIGLPLPEYISSGEGIYLSAIIQFALSLVVLIINRKFFTSGIKALAHLSPNMDSLVALGSGVSFIYSAVITVEMIVLTINGDIHAAHLLAHNLYFEGAAMIVTLITVGKTLESYSKGRTTDAINALMALAPQTAILLVDGKETVVPIENVEKGDTIVVKTGGYIPVDAFISSGSGWVDQSTMTGESVPVEKVVGDEVFCGTVNVNGYFTATAEKVGEDTSLSKIIELVKNVNLSKAPIAKIADKVSSVFVPSVIALALVVLGIWLIAGESFSFALQRSVAVLLISCPCALGLATPVAIMVGSGVGAKNGVLFKNATSLENLGSVKAIVFDKTGTLTYGEPFTTDVISAEGVSKETLLLYAASLERSSEHPLAKAIVKENTIKPLEVENFKSLKGSGVIGTIGGETVFGGNAALMKSKNVDVSAYDAVAAELAEQGKTPLYFAKDTQFLGLIAVADKEKAESKKTIERLKQLGIEVFMLTGDNERTAQAVAKRLGIESERVYAEVLPDEKAKIVEELRSSRKVAMVGDGVNDAPSLTAADVGITLESGSFVAAEAADVMLIGDLKSVVSAVELSRKVIKNVKENLFWAFFYNVICIPIAAGAFYHLFGWSLSPMIAAAAMSVSSVFVVSNALRLNLFKPYTVACDDECELSPRKTENQLKDNKKENENMGTIKKTYTVTGMMCAHCEARVKNAVEKIDGVKECKPDHKKNQAVVVFEKETDDALVISAIEKEGYKVG